MAFRGGHQQKRKRDRERDLENVEREGAMDSPLAILLIQKWSVGEISATLVQELAAAAKCSGCFQRDVAALAALGTHGIHMGNCHRDLVRKYFNKIVTPEPWLVKTKVAARDETGAAIEREASIPILLPHEWVHSLFKWDMQVEILGTPNTHNFWDAVLKGKPARAEMSKEYFSQRGVGEVIPFTIHGDAAPHTEIDSLMVVSIRSMTTEKSVGYTQLLLAVLPKLAKTKTTWDPIWKTLCWSLESLATGLYPSRDPEGHELQGDRARLAGQRLPKGVVYSITGDLEWFYEEFGFPRHNKDKPCPWCEADMHLDCKTDYFLLRCLWGLQLHDLMHQSKLPSFFGLPRQSTGWAGEPKERVKC